MSSTEEQEAPINLSGADACQSEFEFIELDKSQNTDISNDDTHCSSTDSFVKVAPQIDNTSDVIPPIKDPAIVACQAEIDPYSYCSYDVASSKFTYSEDLNHVYSQDSQSIPNSQDSLQFIPASYTDPAQQVVPDADSPAISHGQIYCDVPCDSSVLSFSLVPNDDVQLLKNGTSDRSRMNGQTEVGADPNWNSTGNQQNQADAGSEKNGAISLNLPDYQHLQMNTDSELNTAPSVNFPEYQHLQMNSGSVLNAAPSANLADYQHLQMNNGTELNNTPSMNPIDFQQIQINTGSEFNTTPSMNFSDYQLLQMNSGSEFNAAPSMNFSDYQHLQMSSGSELNTTPSMNPTDYQHIQMSTGSDLNSAPSMSLPDYQNLQLNTGSELNGVLSLNLTENQHLQMNTETELNPVPAVNLSDYRQVSGSELQMLNAPDEGMMTFNASNAQFQDSCGTTNEVETSGVFDHSKDAKIQEYDYSTSQLELHSAISKQCDATQKQDQAEIEMLEAMKEETFYQDMKVCDAAEKIEEDKGIETKASSVSKTTRDRQASTPSKRKSTPKRTYLATNGPSVAYPLVYVSPGGLLTVLLNWDVAVELTADHSIRVVNHSQKSAVATDQYGTSACIYHTAAKMFQEGERVDIEVFWERRAILTPKYFTYGWGSTCYHLNDKQDITREINPDFKDLTKDNSVSLLFSSSAYGPHLLHEYERIANASKFHKLAAGGIAVYIHGIAIKQNSAGDVTVTTDTSKCLRVSPQFGSASVSTRHVDMSVDKDWNIKVCQGENMMSSSFYHFAVSDGYWHYGFDKYKKHISEPLQYSHEVLVQDGHVMYQRDPEAYKAASRTHRQLRLRLHQLKHGNPRETEHQQQQQQRADRGGKWGRPNMRTWETGYEEEEDGEYEERPLLVMPHGNNRHRFRRQNKPKRLNF